MLERRASLTFANMQTKAFLRTSTGLRATTTISQGRRSFSWARIEQVLLLVLKAIVRCWHSHILVASVTMFRAHALTHGWLLVELNSLMVLVTSLIGGKARGQLIRLSVHF